MARKLTKTVIVRDPESGLAVAFTPGATPPAWARSLMTNPAVWDAAEEADDDADADEGGEPPRAGRGSSRDAWAAHAAERGIDFDEDASRDDLIDLVDQLAE